MRPLLAGTRLSLARNDNPLGHTSQRLATQLRRPGSANSSATVRVAHHASGG
jgi:hypothetical protein